MTTHVRETLTAILEEDLGVSRARIGPDSYLIADLGLDSLALMMALTAIEERLGVALSEEEVLRSAAVADLERRIEAALAGAHEEAGV